MLLIILMLLISIIGIFIVDLQTMMFMLLVYAAGFGICSLLNKTHKRNILKIYSILFISGASYMLVCYTYMTYYNYEYLFSPDISGYFLPTTEQYFSTGNYFLTLKDIWTDYNFLSRFQYGYFSYSTFFALLGSIFNANFYIEQNISVLFLYPFVGIVLYKLMLTNSFEKRKAFRYSIMICFCSILLFYSFQTLRDIHILLLYLLAIYFTFNKEFLASTLIRLILVIILCCTFRLESGLFLFVLIPTYLLLTLQKSKQKNLVIFFSVIIFIVGLVILIPNISQIEYVFSANNESYTSLVKEGSGVISTLQKIPIAGDLASIVYTAVQPLPFWGIFTVPRGAEALGPATYNIMNFPLSIASFFNWFVLVYILFWLFSKGLRRKTKGFISKPLQYQLWIGLIFLYMQSAVVEQRRIIGYYCMFYILFFIIYNHIGAKDKKQITLTAIFSFIALQIIGLIYLS